MKTIIYNRDNLKDSDINEKIYRPRAVILNSKNELLLGYCDNTYQFPGGYLEDKETIEEALEREVKEETGILLTDDEISKPFMKIVYYNKDYPKVGINRMTEFSYFYIKTDKIVNLDNSSYDTWEKENNYQNVYVPLDRIFKLLEDSINNNPLNKMIYSDMNIVIESLREGIINENNNI